MSNINDIICRVAIDEEFKNNFLNDPLKATEEYHLSDEEVAQLQDINMQEIQEINSELEERLSKSFVNIPDFAVDGEEAVHSNGHVSHGNDHSNTGGW